MDRVTRWEYKLIHLNVAPPAGGGASGQAAASPPAAPAAAPPMQPPQPASLFSKAYLEQEFPDFYAHPPGSGQSSAQPANPVLQLQGFLNTQGRDGWCLIGLYNVGPLLLMVFRRRSIDQSPSPAAASQEPVLSEILQRLQRLEEVHRPAASEATGSTPPSDGVWSLSEAQRRSLVRDSLCTTAEASRRLGFRSTVSLNTFLRRHGYALGLVKQGSSGWAAVYDGASLVAGNRRQHRWLIVKAEDLPRD